MSAPQPNILWIVTTQWRAQACGYAGDPNARTPHLDQLAAESVDYTQAVTPHPFGPFARAAMLTGVPSPANGVRDYFDPLPAGARTIAHELKERGYATAFFGKWHLAPRDPAAPLVGEVHAKIIVPPEVRGGFEFWEGFESGFLLNDPWLHGTRLPQPVRFEGYQSDVICERAAGWMESPLNHEGTKARSSVPPSSVLRPPSSVSRPLPVRHSVGDGGSPWFCLVSLETPHPPYDAPAAGVLARDPGEIVLPANVPRGGEVEARARRELAGYYAHIEATDAAIGRMRSSGALADAIVVFTSVHGDMHGAHGLFRKGWPHEESVRVPLLVRQPHEQVASDKGQVTSGNNDEAVSLVDLRAMTLAWASGRTPQASRPHAFISMPSVVALPRQCDRVWRGVRTARRKLVLNADGAPWLFFDLERDPLELENLAGDPTRAVEIAELAALSR